MKYDAYIIEKITVFCENLILTTTSKYCCYLIDCIKL